MLNDLNLVTPEEERSKDELHLCQLIISAAAAPSASLIDTDTYKNKVIKKLPPLSIDSEQPASSDFGQHYLTSPCQRTYTVLFVTSEKTINPSILISFLKITS